MVSQVWWGHWRIFKERTQILISNSMNRLIPTRVILKVSNRRRSFFWILMSHIANQKNNRSIMSLRVYPFNRQDLNIYWPRFTKRELKFKRKVIDLGQMFNKTKMIIKSMPFWKPHLQQTRIMKTIRHIMNN